MFSDAHCDTITRIFDLNQSLFENDGHVDIKRLQKTKFNTVLCNLDRPKIYTLPCTPRSLRLLIILCRNGKPNLL